MRRRFPLERPVRVLAGVFGVVALGLGIAAFRAPRIDWSDALGFTALGALLLYGALRGESPAWLEPPSAPGDPPEG